MSCYIAIKVNENREVTMLTMLGTSTDFNKLVDTLHGDLQNETMEVRGFIIKGAEVCHGTIVCTSCEGKHINPATHDKCHHCEGSGKIAKVI
jgi:hypothetical protein